MKYRYGGAIKFAQVNDQAWLFGSTVKSGTIKAKDKCKATARS